MTPLLEIRDLVKKYKNLVAVDGISFHIRPGICFGLLGPNGAGKTTALEVIEDIIPATSGEIFYKGKPRTASFREEIGIQFQHTSLLNFLTVRETLATFQALYRDVVDIEELMDLCHLREIEKNRNDKVSGGQAQRLMLAMALINKPELLFLDEPSTGLDPQARRNLWQIVRTIKEKGKTIILTTHSMEEAEYLCDEIAIMDHGRIIAGGSPSELVQRYCPGGTIILPRENITTPLEELPFVHHLVHNRVEMQVDNVNEGIGELQRRTVDLTGMSVRSPDLEDVFITLTGRQLRD